MQLAAGASETQVPMPLLWLSPTDFHVGSR